MMDVSQMNDIQLDIQRGVKKEDSEYVTNAEASKFWDKLVAEFAAHPDRAYGFVKE